ncbi:hypothetical protein [Chryseobacterium sp. Leaf394]|uniref:hypothetical protein n=1 Tax=Chryseobacterium sp. Leaf394 TaxID=1736361 RepID=UPI0012FF2080|nr:hypothetical protein [Chryseobacterium sp. Leaf394]
MGNIEKLILVTKINDKVVDGSTIMDEKTKEAFKNLSKYTRELLEKEPKMNSYGLNSLKSGLLTYWNESINPDTESFWTELKVNGIDYERKEPLKFALEKNQFRRVDQGMDARKYWTELKNRKEITDKYSQIEIEKIETIIADDENRRLEILKKCLRKNEIPQTQYLKFGECMAYMNNCGIWDKYFNKEEVQQLYDIWTNFKSK